MKEEPLCDLNENSKVKEEDFDDFIENDDYIDDPDFDEDKPIKLPKKRKKSSESDMIIQTRTKLSQYEKSKLVTPDVNPKVVCPQLGRCMDEAETTVSTIFSKLPCGQAKMSRRKIYFFNIFLYPGLNLPVN